MWLMLTLSPESHRKWPWMELPNSSAVVIISWTEHAGPDIIGTNCTCKNFIMTCICINQPSLCSTLTLIRYHADAVFMLLWILISSVWCSKNLHLRCELFPAWDLVAFGPEELNVSSRSQDPLRIFLILEQKHDATCGCSCSTLAGTGLH